jgi:tmRNA-binding protein
VVCPYANVEPESSGARLETESTIRLCANYKGLAKLDVVLAKGKMVHDQSEIEAGRFWERDRARLMPEEG